MLRMVRTSVVALLLLLVIGCAGFAQQTVGVKYSQSPLWDGSYDFSSELKNDAAGPAIVYQSAMADDWICPDGKQICKINWWGSYWQHTGSSFKPYSDSIAGADAPSGLDGFMVTVYNNATAPYDHPGTVKWSQYFCGSAAETYVRTVTKPLGMTEKVYSYELYLKPEQYIPQNRGQKYWLSIQARNTDPGVQWGWHEGENIYGDNALQRFGPQDEWYLACSGHDLAFELTTVPEPGSLSVLGMGAMSLGGMLLRRRRS